MRLVVSDVVQRTRDVRSFVLRDPQGALLPAFSAGAHVNVEVRLADGSTQRRSYSLVNAPSERGHYEIGVLRKADGRGGSLHMHERVAVGSIIDVSEPVNGFPLATHPRLPLLIAGGIGITPIFCMARELLASSAPTEPLELHYFGRSLEDMAYLDELRVLPGLALQPFCAEDPSSAIERLSAVIGTARSDQHLYVCGPAGMIQSIVNITAAHSWHRDRVHYELFGSQVIDRGNTPLIVRLARGRRHIEVPADVSVLDALLAHGVDAPHDCRTGVCGSCLTPVLAGAVDHRDSFLTEDDKREGGLMCICVSRAFSSELELDL